MQKIALPTTPPFYYTTYKMRYSLIYLENISFLFRCFIEIHDLFRQHVKSFCARNSESVQTTRFVFHGGKNWRKISQWRAEAPTATFFLPSTLYPATGWCALAETSTRNLRRLLRTILIMIPATEVVTITVKVTMKWNVVNSCGLIHE